MVAFAFACAFLASRADATTYKQPPREVIDILDAPSPPLVVPSPNGEWMLLVDVETMPPIELLARPFLRLGGVRVDPALGAKRREFRMKGFAIQSLRGGSDAARRVELPEGARIGMPVWSFDSKHFAFTRDLANGVELWVGDAGSGEVRAVPGVRINDILAPAFEWTRDHRHLLVRGVPQDRGPAPAVPAVPTGPNVSETAGKKTRMATFQDLLSDVHDEALFEHYATSQLLMVDAESGDAATLGRPALFVEASWSPNGEFLRVLRLERPFSFRVPYDYFARVVEVWTREGELAGTLAQLPVADQVPQQGVPTGARNVGWQPLHPATLVWVEALDGGDPRAKVAHRDRIRRVRVAEVVRRGADLAAAAEDVLQMKERVRGVWWLGRRDQVWIGEYDRDRRWTTTWSADFGHAGRALRKVFDRSINDAYGDPGNPVLQTRPDGSRVARQDGDFIYLSGRGATPAGDRPFLDRIDLRSLQKARLFQSPADADEQFLAFVSPTRVLATRQSPTEPPNQYLVDLVGGRHTKVTDYRDPAPQLAGIEKRLIEYKRADGTPLTAFL
jgi:dipeptidyl aminopeptidase/acylaminoacyl peptidase